MTFFFSDLTLKKEQLKNRLVYSRRSVITKDFLGVRVRIYNGKNFKSILVRKPHLGFRFGQFSFSRLLAAKRHNTKKERKNKNK